MRGLKRNCSARVVMRGHAFMQNIRGAATTNSGLTRAPIRRVAHAFSELARTI